MPMNVFVLAVEYQDWSVFLQQQPYGSTLKCWERIFGEDSVRIKKLMVMVEFFRTNSKTLKNAGITGEALILDNLHLLLGVIKISSKVKKKKKHTPCFHSKQPWGKWKNRSSKECGRNRGHK